MRAVIPGYSFWSSELAAGGVLWVENDALCVFFILILSSSAWLICLCSSYFCFQYIDSWSSAFSRLISFMRCSFQDSRWFYWSWSSRSSLFRATISTLQFWQEAIFINKPNNIRNLQIESILYDHLIVFLFDLLQKLTNVLVLMILLSKVQLSVV